MIQLPDPIVAFAPLRWTAMPSAAQRVLTQFARTRSVFVIEPLEPLEPADREHWELKCGAPELLVCRPRIVDPGAVAFRETPIRMARALLYWLDIEAFVALLYAPSDFATAQALAPSLVIHDRSLDRERPRAAARAAAAAIAPFAIPEPSSA